MFILLMSCLVRGTKDTQTDPTDTQDLDTAESTDSGQTNAAPSVTVTLSPEAGHYLGETLSCTATASDPEDGALTPTLSWLLNNTNLPTAEGELYIDPNSMRIGDELACVATAIDSDGLESVVSQSVLVEAKPILIDAIEITDSDGDGEIHNDETVFCLVEIGDDGDVVDFNVEWRLNETLLFEGIDYDLDLSLTEAMPGDTLECMISVTNGDLGGSDMATVQVTIGNRLPLAPTVSIEPLAPRSEDDLLCEAVAIDPDGEDTQLDFLWSDGNATISGSALSASYTSEGDDWTCEVTASDAQGEGQVGTATVSILPGCSPTQLGTDTLSLGSGESITLNLIQGCDSPTGAYELTHAYYMMTTEVTQGMFEAVSNHNPVSSSTIYGYGDEYPAFFTSWHMAAHFANEVTGIHNTNNPNITLDLCYSCLGTHPVTDVSCDYAMDPNQCNGYSLPTAAEWEFAARSGTARDFWFGIGPELGGDVLDLTGCGNGDSDTTILIEDGTNTAPLSDYAWFCGNQSDSTYTNTSKPVGLKLPNGYGLYDMVGNVSEWVTDDDSQTYPAGTVDPVSWGSSTNKLIMNGNWSSNAGAMTLTSHSTSYEEITPVGTGFRLRRLVP